MPESAHLDREHRTNRTGAGQAGVGCPVQERTVELAKANSSLLEEIVIRKQAEATWMELGLGLAIAQRQVKIMGGNLRVRSSPAQGAIFSFDIDFPLASARRVTRRDELTAVERLAASFKVHALVVDVIERALIESGGDPIQRRHIHLLEVVPRRQTSAHVTASSGSDTIPLNRDAAALVSRVPGPKGHESIARGLPWETVLFCPALKGHRNTAASFARFPAALSGRGREET
jgi:hypothetical protein